LWHFQFSDRRRITILEWAVKTEVSVEELLRWRLAVAEEEAPPAPRAIELLELARQQPGSVEHGNQPGADGALGETGDDKPKAR
jgi:hypothetical protein